MHTIIQRIEIDAGHRLLKHEGKCRNVHGHRYVFEVTLQASGLDEVGRVVDFGDVKRIIGGWLDENWDHGFIYQEGDPIGPFLLAAGSKAYSVPFAPTAEMLSRYFFEHVCRGELAAKLPAGVRVVLVRLYETPNASALAGGV